MKNISKSNQAMADLQDNLPKNWVVRESKSRPGRYYFANGVTGVSTWRRTDVFAGNSKQDVQSLHNLHTKAEDQKLDNLHKSEPPENVRFVPPKCPKELEKQFIKSQKDKHKSQHNKSHKSQHNKSQRSQPQPQPQHNKTKEMLSKAAFDDSISKKLEKASKLLKPVKMTSPTNPRTFSQSKSLSNHSAASACRSSSLSCTETKKARGTAEGRGKSLNISKCSLSDTSVCAKKQISEVEKTAAELEDQFDKLVKRSAVKSGDYISLDGPIGSKHVKQAKVDNKSVGPIPSMKRKTSRFSPFPNPANKESIKEVSRIEKTRKAKSETTLVLEKFETIFQDDGLDDLKKSPWKDQKKQSHDLPESPRQHQQKSSIHKSQQQFLRQQCSPKYKQQQQDQRDKQHDVQQQQLQGAHQSHPLRKQQHHESEKQQQQQRYQPHQRPPQKPEHQRSIQQLSYQSQPFSNRASVSVPAQRSDEAPEDGDDEDDEKCLSMQRVSNFSMDDDWEMLSASSLDEDIPADVQLVSFDLNSDVVMAAVAEEGSAGGADGDKQTASAEPRVCVVIDTCSMGNLSSLLKVKTMSLTDGVSEKVVEYSLYRILIPWQVLQELDFIKDNKTGAFTNGKQNGAKRVARIIHAELSTKTSIVKLQSPIDDAASLNGFRIQTEDDHIIKCCLSLKARLSAGHAVVLMTEDINLINKCVACDVLASQYSELRNKCATQPSKSVRTPKSTTAKVQTPMVKSQEYGVTRVGTPTPFRSVPPPRAVIKPLPVQAPLRTEPRPTSSPSPQVDHNPRADSVSLYGLTKKESPKKTPEQIYEILARLEAVVKPVLCKCLAVEMSSAFGDIWENIVYKKPPWTSLLPVLESLFKHWLAVFGQVLNRHTVKSVKTLLDLFQRKFSTKADDVVDGVIAAISLTRTLDKSARGYAAEARALLPQLNQILTECRDKGQNQPLSDLSECAADLGAADRSTAVVSKEPVADVARELTQIFTTLAAACEALDISRLREAVSIVMRLGSAFQSSMTIPVDSLCVDRFLDELRQVATHLAIEVSMSGERLRGFICSNRQLMLEGLSQLEHLAQSLQRQL